MQVRELMKGNVVTVTESDGLAVALQRMHERGLHHMPVVRGEEIVGVLSERDLLRAASVDSPIGMQAKACDAMTHPVETIAPDADIADAAAMLAVDRIGCLPVVEDGHLVGMLTTTDVVCVVAQCPVEPGAHHH